MAKSPQSKLTKKNADVDDDPRVQEILEQIQYGRLEKRARMQQVRRTLRGRR